MENSLKSTVRAIGLRDLDSLKNTKNERSSSPIVDWTRASIVPLRRKNSEIAVNLPTQNIYIIALRTLVLTFRDDKTRE